MDLTPDVVALGLIWFVVFLFSLTVHEAAHALASYQLGDSTAYEGGQVSLNPVPHMQREPFGTLLMPVLSYGLSLGSGSPWMMGWASAPYDPFWARRHPKRAALMALAGPVSNLLLVGLAGLAIRIGLSTGVFEVWDTMSFHQLIAATEPGAWEGLATLLSILFTLNLVLFAFNLLPVPPLDGSGVLGLFLPERWVHRYLDTLQDPMWSLLGLLVAWRFFGFFYWPLHVVAVLILIG